MVTSQDRNREQKNSDISEAVTANIPFRAANGSRPDISLAVNWLSKKQVSLTKSDCIEDNRIFRYLRGTSELVLIFKAQGEKLEAYSDASYKDDEHVSPTGGYVTRLFRDIVLLDRRTLIKASEI